jgi:uncharacterized 2Fe-2S/4Fe-4S cluster protein (DUF4445 family)
VHGPGHARLYLSRWKSPTCTSPTGDLERLKAALEEQWGIDGVTATCHHPAEAAAGAAQGRVAGHRGAHRPGTHTTHRIVEVWPGLHEGGLYGLAIDLGSTTIAAHLCDLQPARAGLGGLMNPQIRFGEDLMSRVSYAMMNPGGDAEMTAPCARRSTIWPSEIAAEAGSTRPHRRAVFVCNPVMHHLLLGIDPVELGQAPLRAGHLRQRDALGARISA